MQKYLFSRKLQYFFGSVKGNLDHKKSARAYLDWLDLRLGANKKFEEVAALSSAMLDLCGTVMGGMAMMRRDVALNAVDDKDWAGHQAHVVAFYMDVILPQHHALKAQFSSKVADNIATASFKSA